MKNVFLGFPEFIRLAALALGLGMQMHVFAGTEQKAATTSLPSLPADIAELRFRDFFVTPAGPRGLEISPALLALDGRRVRILGYMAQQEASAAGYFMLAPVPVDVGDASNAKTDDLPPATLLVQLAPEETHRVAPYQPGLLVLTGTLNVGILENVGGPPSMARLQLDAPSAKQAQLSQ